MATDQALDLSLLKRKPRHIGIIMDGNGRWAQAQGLPRSEGHIKGQETLRATLEAAVEFGIEVLTVYAFSTENWERPTEEVNALMELLVSAIASETDELIAQGVRMLAIGDLSRLPEQARRALAECIERTAGGSRITFVVALSYSSRDELVRATQKLLRKGAQPEKVTEVAISETLDTAGLPDPDLIIRTGGEKRISNFLLWQAAYAELYFCDIYWPDFGRQALYVALKDYSDRERRYGKIREQLNPQEILN